MKTGKAVGALLGEGGRENKIHYSVGNRSVKNSLVYYVKKRMAHLLLHKCYIHTVFSVTVTEKKFELLAAG